MKKHLKIALILLLTTLALGANGPRFDDFFLDKTMRIDFFQFGTKTIEKISLDEVVEEPVWAGSITNLLDTMNLGQHIARVYDFATNELIYSRGFSSVSAEWRTTDEAAREIYRTFSASARIPYPKSLIRFTISSRNRKNEFVEIFSTEIDPNSRFVNRDKPLGRYKTRAFLSNGNSHNKVDIVILPEGYTKSEMRKFRKDVKHFMKVFFSTVPFQDHQDKFNIWYIEAASEESGIDDPRKEFFSKSAFGLTFNSLDVDRYVLTLENKTIRRIAANAPYDQIYILFNSPKYGGGGIFNLYSTCYSHSDNEEQSWWPDYVFVHEFGHAFAGLADEYYSSAVAYNEFYPKGTEPWEPNITALLDSSNVKWRSLMNPDTPVPTPWNKEFYDAIPRSKPLEREELLREQQYWGEVGVFKGAGYSSEGLYRPYLDCRMFSKSIIDFCPVCSNAIVKMINFYTE